MTDRSAKGLITIAHSRPDFHLEDIPCTYDQYDALHEPMKQHVVNSTKSGVPCRIQVDDIELMVHPERVLIFWQPTPPQDAD